jgi:ArsR family transcriptional regulator
MEEHICGKCEHQRALMEEVTQRMPCSEILNDAADLLKLFGDGTRIKILFELLSQELCVCDIADRLGMTVSAISHQLRILKQGRLVKSRREGKTVYYSLADSHVKTIFYLALEHCLE